MRILPLVFGALSLLALAPGARAQNVTVVADCTAISGLPTGPNGPLYIDQTGKLCGIGAAVITGTADVNLKQVNGATVNVGVGAASTGTQRVTTSTDSTIGTVTAVTAVTTVTNPVGIKGSDGSTIMSTTNPVVIGGSVASGAADSGNPSKVGAVYNSTKPTVTNGQRVDAQSGTRGSLDVQIMDTDGVTGAAVGTVSDSNTGASALTTRAISQGFDGTQQVRFRTIAGAVAAGSAGTGNSATEGAGTPFSNITTATTTTVKSGAGILHRVVINTPIASATITIYDSTTGSGTKIATMTIPSTITGEAPATITYDVAFATGLTIVTSGATDLTVSYR